MVDLSRADDMHDGHISPQILSQHQRDSLLTRIRIRIPYYAEIKVLVVLLIQQKICVKWIYHHANLAIHCALSAK